MKIKSSLIVSRIHSEIDLQEVYRLIAMPRKFAKALNLQERRAIYSAIIVLLCARMEAYIEDIFEFAILEMRLHNISTISETEESDIVTNFSNPSTRNTNILFSRIGLVDILSRIHIDRIQKHDLYKTINCLVNTRHDIAHGKECSANVKFPVNLYDCKRYYCFVRNFMNCFERETYKYIELKSNVNIR